MKDILPRMRQHVEYTRVTKTRKLQHLVNNIVCTIALMLSIDFCFFVTVGIKYKIICFIFSCFCGFVFILSKKLSKTT